MAIILEHLLSDVNATTSSSCTIISNAHNCDMTDRKRGPTISPENIEEAAALKAIYKERAKVSQAEFGAQSGIGSQGMVWQYLNAKAALHLKAAVQFAHMLGCSVADFSPRLADEQQYLAMTEEVNSLMDSPDGEYYKELFTGDPFPDIRKMPVEDLLTLVVTKLKNATPAKVKYTLAKLEFDLEEALARSNEDLAKAKAELAKHLKKFPSHQLTEEQQAPPPPLPSAYDNPRFKELSKEIGDIAKGAGLTLLQHIHPIDSPEAKEHVDKVLEERLGKPTSPVPPKAHPPPKKKTSKP